MNTFSPSIVAGSTALAVTFGGVVAHAEPASEEYAARDAASIKRNLEQFKNEAAKNGGSGAIPNTEGAGKMAAGSVMDLGMTGKETWDASQAGWSLVWTALALIGGLIISCHCNLISIENATCASTVHRSSPTECLKTTPGTRYTDSEVPDTGNPVPNTGTRHAAPSPTASTACRPSAASPRRAPAPCPGLRRPNPSSAVPSATSA